MPNAKKEMFDGLHHANLQAIAEQHIAATQTTVQSAVLICLHYCWSAMALFPKYARRQVTHMWPHVCMLLCAIRAVPIVVTNADKCLSAAHPIHLRSWECHIKPRGSRVRNSAASPKEMRSRCQGTPAPRWT